MDNRPLTWPITSNSPPVPVVVLEHVEPGGGVHWDLLMARGPQQGAVLWGLRCQERPDGSSGAVIHVVPMPDHRAAWLELEGAVSGGRGVVRRLARGQVRVRDDVAEVQWDDGRVSRWGIGPVQNSRSHRGVSYLVSGPLSKCRSRPEQ